jgi:hypothetical protein
VTDVLAAYARDAHQAYSSAHASLVDRHSECEAAAQVLRDVFQELMVIMHAGRVAPPRQPSISHLLPAHEMAARFLAALVGAPPGGLPRPFSSLTDAMLGIRLELYQVCTNLASRPQDIAGAAPAIDMLRKCFLDLLTLPPPDQTAGSELDCISTVHRWVARGDSDDNSSCRGSHSTTGLTQRLHQDVAKFFTSNVVVKEQDVCAAVDMVIRREEIDWSFVMHFVPAAVKTNPSMEQLLLDIARAVFVEATSEDADEQGSALRRIASVVTLLRYIFAPVVKANGSTSPDFERYIAAFQHTFLNESLLASGKRSARLLLKVLNQQVPHEEPLYLQLHCKAVHRGQSASSASRSAVSDYMALAQTRLLDLGHTLTLSLPTQNSATDVKTEVHGFVVEYRRTGVVPPAIFKVSMPSLHLIIKCTFDTATCAVQAHMFRRNWWKQSAQPTLLAPVSSERQMRQIQRNLIEAVRSSNVVGVLPKDALVQFDLAVNCADDFSEYDVGTGPRARLMNLLGQFPEACWSCVARGGDDDASKVRTLCTKLDAELLGMVEASGSEDPETRDSTDGGVHRDEAVVQLIWDAFQNAYTALLKSTSPQEKAHCLFVPFCHAVRHIQPTLHSRLYAMICDQGVEQSGYTCDGLALLLALESSRAAPSPGEMTLAARIFSAIAWWKSAAWLHWFLRFSAAYSRVVLTTVRRQSISLLPVSSSE